MPNLHIWLKCHHCGSQPIVGTRYECNTCPIGPDTNLCEKCWQKLQAGNIQHPSDATYSPVPGEHSFSSYEGTPGNQYDAWLSIDAPPLSPMSISNGFLVRPEFGFGEHISFGTAGFIVRFNNNTIMLSALHCMDESIKHMGIDASYKNSSYTGEELPSAFTHLNFYDVLEKNWMMHYLGAASSMLRIPNAHLYEVEPKSDGDICAFIVEPDAKVRPGQLASKTPDVGEPVWIAARLDCGATTSQAVVVEKTQTSFVFRYLANNDIPTAISGTAVLNKDGEVVGIYCGSGCYEGYEFGHGNHVENVLGHLLESGV